MNISNQYPKKGSFVNLFRLQYDYLGEKKLTQLFPGWEENGKLVPGFYAVTTGRHILEPADMVSLASGYTVVLIDKSTGDFHDFQEVYKHNFQQQSDTGLKMNLLQKYVFIPLDLFRSNVQNKGIKNKMDAWLAFLSMDDPDMIIQLITEYPEFKAMYHQAYEICRNVEALMGIFSEELRIMDRNTVKYMVDQMQEEIDSQKQKLEQKDNQLNNQKRQLKQKDILLSSKIQKIESLEQELRRLKENQK